MPMFSDLSNLSHYYSGGSSSLNYLAGPYAGHSSIVAANYRGPSSSSSSSSYTKPSSRAFANRNYKPHLATISENQITRAGLSRINSPKLLYHSSPKYKIRKPISINTADIDVSSNRYRSNLERAPISSPKKDTVPIKTPERSPSFKENKDETVKDREDDVYMPRIDKNYRSTIKRERTLVRLHTIRNIDDYVDNDKTEADESSPKRDNQKQNETVKVFDKEIKVHKQKWRENFDPDELKPKKRVQQKPLSERLVEKFMIKDKEEKEEEKIMEERRRQREENIINFDGSKLQRRGSRRQSVKKVPSFHEICKTISSESIDEDLNPGQNIKRRNTRKLSNYDVMKAIRRDSAEFNQQEIQMLDDMIKEAHLDGNNLTSDKPENTENEDPKENIEDNDAKRRKKFTKKKSNEKLVEDEVKEEKPPQRKKIVKKKTSGSLDKAIEAITPKGTKENKSEINNNMIEKNVEHNNIQNKESEVKDDKQQGQIVKKKYSGSLDKSIEAITPSSEKLDKNEDKLEVKQYKKVVPKITGTVEIETKPNLKLVVDNIQVEETVLSSSSPNTKKFKYNVIIEEVISPVKEKSDIFKDKENNNKITKLEEQLPKIIKGQENEKSKMVNKLLDKIESSETPKENLDKAGIEKNQMIDKLLGKKEVTEKPQDSLNKAEEEKNKMLDKLLRSIETKQETVNKAEEKDKTFDKIFGKKESVEKPEESLDKAEIEKNKMVDKLLGKKKSTEKQEKIVDKAEEEKDKIFDQLLDKKESTGNVQEPINKAEEEKNKMLDKLLSKPGSTETTQETVNKLEEKEKTLDKIFGKKESVEKQQESLDKAEKEKKKMLDKLLGKIELTDKQEKIVDKVEEEKDKILDKVLGEKVSTENVQEPINKAEEEKNKMFDKLLIKKDLTEKLQESSIKKAEDEKNKMLDKLLGKKGSAEIQDESKSQAEDEKNKIPDKLLGKKDLTEKLQESSINKAEDEKNKMVDKLLGKKESAEIQDESKSKAEDENNKMPNKLHGKKDLAEKLLESSIIKAEDEKTEMLDKLLDKKESTEKLDESKWKAEDEKNKIPDKLLGKKDWTEKPKESTVNKAEDEKNKMLDKLLGKKESAEKQDESKSKAENEKNKMLDKILGWKENRPIYKKEENKMNTKKLEEIEKVETPKIPENKKVETPKIIENKKSDTQKIIENKKLETEISSEQLNVKLEDKPIPKQNILLKYGQKVEPKFNKTESKLEKPNLNAADRRKQIKKQENLDELDIDNFWDRMGKRETIYYKDRRKYLEEKREREKKDICWTPDWAMDEEDTDKTAEVATVNKDKHIALAKMSARTEKSLQSVKSETPNISLDKSTKSIEKIPVSAEANLKVEEKAVSLDKSKLNQEESVVNLAKKSQCLEKSANQEKSTPTRDKLSTASNITSACLDKQSLSLEKPSINKSATTLNKTASNTKLVSEKRLSTTTEKSPQNIEPPKPKLSVKQKSEECGGKIRPRLQRKSKSEEQFKRERLNLTALQLEEMKVEIKEIKLEPIKPELDFIIKEKFDPVLKPNTDLIVPSASEVLAIEKVKEEAKKTEESTEQKTDEETDAEDKSFAPLQTNILAIPEPKPKPKPKWFDECPVVIMATPRDLRTRAPVHKGRPVPVPKVTYVSESEDSDSSDEESTSSDSSGGSDEYETNIVFDAGTANKRKSTSSNDSGFDSSAPASPANIRNRPDDCDVNCHKKCEKLTANLCGVNQKMIVEALRSVKKGSTNASTSSGSESSSTLAPAHNPAFQMEPMEASSAYTAYQRSGRVTPPATSIPRFRKYTVEDFSFLKVLGKGSFGKVLLAELKNTEYYYAVKCLKKDIVLEDDDVECTLIERKVLALGTKHPYLCHLFCTFQTESHLFFVMEYLNGGDLMFHIQVSGRFPEPRGRFYGAEIVSGLKFLHSKGIVYRDLKLDNILLDFDGHVRIADFGMCKLQIFLDRTADTFCGTPDYMAPEIIKGQHYNQGVDWWSFGVLLYEMLIGQSPFSGCDEDELFWSICNERPVIPAFLSKEASQILTLLLEKDCSKRLGNRYCPAGDIKEQSFFHEIDWDKLERRQLEAPFKPKVQHPLDTQYFDKAFTAERVKLTPIEKDILHSMDQTQFHGFSYTNPNATDK